MQPDTDPPHGGADTGASWVPRQVLEGVRRRDREALGRFYDLAFPYVYNLAFRLTGHRQAAEDMAQEVFIKVHGAAERIDVERSPKPWLTTITYNAFRDERRRGAARPEHPADPAELNARHVTSATPESEWVQKERTRLLEAALDRLDEPSRVVVILHDYYGRSHEEIATLVGTSHAAVRKRHSRALKRMTEIIRDLQA